MKAGFYNMKCCYGRVPGFVFLVVVLLISFTYKPLVFAKTSVPSRLFKEAESVPDLIPGNDPARKRSRVVSLDSAAIFSQDNVAGDRPMNSVPPMKPFVLNLFDNASYLAIPDKVQKNPSGSYTWSGHIEGIQFSQVTLIVHDGKLTGSVSLRNHIYQIRPLGGSDHLVVEKDPAGFPQESVVNPPQETNSKPPVAGDVSSQPDDGSIIDVMVVYTEDARVGAGGTSNMEDLIDLAISETNTSFTNSDITPVLRLIHTKEVVYSEVGFDVNVALDDLTNGTVPDVHTLRDDFGADLVVMLVEGDGTFCASAWTFVTENLPNNNEFGYSIVDHDCATGNLSFGFAIGTNMGARTDRAVDGTDGEPFDFNHAYVDEPSGIRTLRAVSKPVTTTRIQYWSNPDINFFVNGIGEVPLGIAEGDEAADNARAIDALANEISNYRTEVSELPNVITITEGPAGDINPVNSEGTVNLQLEASDTEDNTLSFFWTADCAGLATNGSFNGSTLQNPIWTAPQNLTGIQQECFISVDISNGQFGDDISSTYTQKVRAAITTTEFKDSGQALGSRVSLSVDLGDVDGDGDLDSFVAVEGMGPSSLLLNDGEGDMIISQSFLKQGGNDVKFVDADGDGDLDALVVNSNGGVSRYFQNNGSGTLINKGQFTDSLNTNGLALGDIDGDGDLDGVLANGSGDPNFSFRNLGNGIWDVSLKGLGAGHSNAVALGDLDGDDDTDVFVANGEPGASPDNANRLYLNNGSGVLVVSPLKLFGDAYSADVALADLDGDDDLDAFVANAGSTNNANKVWINNGSGDFTDSGQSLGDQDSHGVALGDLDGDGDMDAFVVNGDLGNGSSNKVWLNEGDGTFIDSGQVLGFANSQDVALGDLDGDGDLDAYVANDGPDKVYMNLTIPPVEILPIEDEVIVKDNVYTGVTPVFTGAGPITWSLIDGPTGMTINTNTGVVRWGEPLTGDYTIIIQASNGEDSDIESWLLFVEDTGITPGIANIPDHTIPAGQPYAGPMPVPSGTGPFTWSLTQGPVGMTIDDDTGEVSWIDPTEAGSPHSISISVQNSIATISESWSLTVVTDPALPSVPKPPDATIENNSFYSEAPTFTGTYPVTWFLVEGPAGMTVDPSTGEVNWDNPKVGTHKVTIAAINSAGTDTVSWTVTVDATQDTQPFFTIVENIPYIEIGFFELLQPTSNQTIFECSLNSKPNGMTAEPLSFFLNGFAFCFLEWDSPTADGSPHSVEVFGEQFENAASVATATIPFTLRVVDAAPVIETLPDQLTGEGMVFTGPTPQVTGVTPITWSLAKGPVGMTINSSTGVVSWPNPTADGSPHTIIIQAENESGVDTESWELEVTSDMIAPVIISPFLVFGAAPITTTVNGDIAIQLPDASVTIQDNQVYTGPTLQFTGVQPITWTLLNGPSDMTIDSTTGVVTWNNPITTFSPYTITVQATNSEGNDSISWTLNVVSEVTAAADVGNFDNTSIQEGEKYTKDVPIDAGASPFTCRLTNAPEGMTAEYFRAGLGFSEHCKVTWENPVAEGSPHSITLRITDNNSQVDEVSWDLSVSSSAMPDITPIADKSIATGQPYTDLALLASGTLPVTWSLVTAPPGMLVDSDAGVVTWATPIGGIHPVTIQAQTNNDQAATHSWNVSVDDGTQLQITSGPSGNPNPVSSGGTVNLSVVVEHPLGKSINYSWASDCSPLTDSGSFSDSISQNTQWIAVENTFDFQITCSLTVTATDADGIFKTGTLVMGVLPLGAESDISLALPDFSPSCFENTCNQSLTQFSITNNSAAAKNISVSSSKTWLDLDPNPQVTDAPVAFDIPKETRLFAPQATTTSASLNPGQSGLFSATVNTNIGNLPTGRDEAVITITDTDTTQPLGSFVVVLTLNSNPFKVSKQKRIASPYWQADAAVYTFMGITHPGLQDMASNIGVEVHAIQNDGAPFGPAAEFTVSGSSTVRLFIVGTNNPVINPDTVPTAQFIIGTTSGKYGQLVINPKASHPEQVLGDGYPDVTMLNIWGAVVVQATSTGFAMEFVGDLQDSRALSQFLFSGVN